MSEIRERAKEWVDGWDVALAKLHGLGMGLIPEDTKECYGIITDLLAELERVENDTAKVKLAYAEGKITGRQQAAREALEIVGSGGWYEELEVAIKDHFNLGAQ